MVSTSARPGSVALGCAAFMACVAGGCGTGTTGGSGFPKSTEWNSLTVSSTGGHRPAVVAVADFDGNGLLDVAVGYQGSDPSEAGASILFQTSAGVFTSVAIGSGADFAGINALAMADIDGDMHLDLVAACNQRLLFLKSGENPQEAAAWQTFTIADSTGMDFNQWNDVAVADIDAANGPDIVACNGNVGRLSFFRSPAGVTNGDGWTRVDIDAATRTGAAGLFVADVDGDGRNDVYSTAPGEAGERVAWYQNPGADASGAWPKHPIGNMAGTRIVAGDLDRDGDADVAVIAPADRQVGWYVRPADPATAWNGFLLTQFVTNTPVDLKIADVDGNGQNDLVVATMGAGSLRWFTPVGAATAQWTENNLIDLIDSPGRIAIGNVDGQGRADVVAPLIATDPGDDQAAWFQNPE